ncbi:hypothetical protein F2Q69_00061206 [Brassica cretica]|uniref:Uncharacterized protein n=1 Tax=Brassica cretica TaxID=69181 RepID=A0A8S9RQZ6_BRACR|nr:hypothetical protein F2Q69_00061206 [Brassica cretica]
MLRSTTRNILRQQIEELASELDEKHFLLEKMVAELESEKSFQSLECNELAEKRKILKTKEFKSLSIHLRDLKDDAEAKCTHAREKAGLSIPINSTAGVVENHCHQRTIRNLVAGTST